MPKPQKELPLADDQERLLSQIRATFDFMPDDPDGAAQLSLWIQWQVTEILKQISFEDLTSSELMSLVGILGPVFARVLAGDVPPGCSDRRDGSPRLRSV